MNDWHFHWRNIKKKYSLWKDRVKNIYFCYVFSNNHVYVAWKTRTAYFLLTIVKCNNFIKIYESVINLIVSRAGNNAKLFYRNFGLINSVFKTKSVTNKLCNGLSMKVKFGWINFSFYLLLLLKHFVYNCHDFHSLLLNVTKLHWIIFVPSYCSTGNYCVFPSRL